MISNEKMNEEIKTIFPHIDRECVVDCEFSYKNINIGNVTLNGTYRYRSFQHGYSNVYTLDDGQNIISITDFAPLPAYVFDSFISCVDMYSGGVALHFYLKDEYMSVTDATIVSDALGTESIAGFDLLFEDNDITATPEMECVISFYPEDEDKVYKSYLEYEILIKEKLSLLGFDLNDEMADDEYAEQGVEDRKGFLKFVNKLSVEELNQFLRQESEFDDDF